MLENRKLDVKIKLAGLWASTMFLYIYGDYFGLYVPGTLRDMLAGKFPPFGLVSQGVLFSVSMSLAIPGLMIFLSLALAPVANRWCNIVLGVVYTLIVLVTIPGSWTFYIAYSIIEMALTVLVVWYAWKWPRTPAET